jgi:sensor histidine kinase YesM
MLIKREKIFFEIKMLVLFFGASIVQSLVMCGGRCNTFYSFSRVVAFTFFMWIFLWRGNSVITDVINTRLSWIEFPVKRFLVGLASTVLYTFVAIYSLVFVFRTFLGFNFGSSIQFTIITAVVFTTIISLFLHSRQFLLHWRKAVFDSQKFQRERIASRYQSLKSRVNPQLLFNSLQSLRGIVISDKENAIRFIKHLSEVYRYILDTRETEVVTGRNEMKFLRSFVFLLETRFKNGIRVSFDLESASFYLSPLSLQLLLESLTENCRFDESVPLDVSMKIEGLYIVVNAGFSGWTSEDSKKAILLIVDNIRDQYRLLSDYPVDYTLEVKAFTCRLPLILLEDFQSMEDPLTGLNTL